MTSNSSLRSTKNSVIIKCVIIQEHDNYSFIYLNPLDFTQNLKLTEFKNSSCKLNIDLLKSLLSNFLKSNFKEKPIIRCNQNTMSILNQKDNDFLKNLTKSVIIDRELSPEFFLLNYVNCPSFGVSNLKKTLVANDQKMDQTVIASNKKIQQGLIANNRKMGKTLIANNEKSMQQGLIEKFMQQDLIAINGKMQESLVKNNERVQRALFAGNKILKDLIVSNEKMHKSLKASNQRVQESLDKSNKKH